MGALKPVIKPKPMVHRLMINPPVLALTDKRVHQGTFVEISRHTDFTKREEVLVSKKFFKVDGDDILTIKNTINIRPDEVVYARYAYILGTKEGDEGKDNFEVQDWSRMSSSYGDQVGFKFDDNILATPEVYIDDKSDRTGVDLMELRLDGYKVLVGPKGVHKYTTWEIADSDNNVIFSRVKDEDNLTSITVSKSLFKNDKIYFIRAKVFNSFNGESNFGICIYNTGIMPDPTYKVTVEKPVFYGEDLKMLLEVYTPLAKEIEIEIREVNEEYELPVAIYKGKYSTTHNLVISKELLYNIAKPIKPDVKYNIYTSLVFDDKGKTVKLPLRYIDTVLFQIQQIYPNRVESNYTSQYHSLEELELGPTIINTREFKDGTFFLGCNTHRNNVNAGAGQNELVLYARYGKQVRSTGGTLELPAGAPIITQGHNDYPIINILPMYNDLLMINYVTYDTARNYKKSVWALYTVNLATYTFVYQHHIVQDDEYLGTSVSSSAVVARDNTVYYIPHAYGTVVNGNPTQNVRFEFKDLPLFKLKVVKAGDRYSFTREMVKQVVRLNVKKHMTMVPYKGLDVNTEDKFLILGGTSDIEHQCEDAPGGNKLHGLYYYELFSNAIILFNPNGATDAEKFKDVGTLPQEMFNRDKQTVSCYNLCAQRRADKKIVIFNNSQYTRIGGLAQDTATWVLDPDKQGTSEFVKLENNDTTVDMPFLTTVARMNGDFLRIAYSMQQRAPVLVYPSDPVIDGVLDTSVVNKHLVVGPNERMTIDNPYAYETITIQGDSEANSGILTWVDNTRIRSFNCGDRIITRNTKETQAEADSKKKERLYVLDGVAYEVEN